MRFDRLETIRYNVYTPMQYDAKEGMNLEATLEDFDALMDVCTKAGASMADDGLTTAQRIICIKLSRNLAELVGTPETVDELETTELWQEQVSDCLVGVEVDADTIVALQAVSDAYSGLMPEALAPQIAHQACLVLLMVAIRDPLTLKQRVRHRIDGTPDDH